MSTATVSSGTGKKTRTSGKRCVPAVVPFPVPGPDEQLLTGHGNWETYLMLDLALTDRGFRVRYYRGKIDIMSISFRHESIKKLIGMFIEAYCDIRNLDFVAWGSTTRRVEGVMGGEPDEAYNFGPIKTDDPQLAVEVALSSGGIDKLPFWAEKRISEVWVWQNDRLHVFGFRGDSYEPLTASRALPDFPITLAGELMETQPASAAVREFRCRVAAMRDSSP